MNSKGRIKVGVIGVGYLGEHHARIYSSMATVELVGVVDIDKERADRVAAKYGTTPYYDHRSLFGRIDAASIAVPTVLHYPISLEFIREGIDLLIEKPITATISEADNLCKESAKKGVLIQVGHVERFNPAFTIMEGHVKNPRFIETHRLGPYVGRGIDVDVILDLMIHDIDIILSIVKSDPVDIRAVGVPVLTNHIDIASARLEFASGCIANITASRVSRERMRKIRIFQPDTYLSLDYAEQSLSIYRRLIEDGSPRITGEEIRPEKEEPLRRELISFISAVQDRKEPAVTCSDGREALRVALKIVEDAKKRL